jgi:hypothetical protein
MGNSNKRSHFLLLYKNIIEKLPFIDEKGEKKELVNTFICPICLKTFDISDYDNITIEHVPPKKLGGRPLLLTCKDCNNVCGSNLDVHLINCIRNSYSLRNFTSKTHKATLHVDDMSINAYATLKNDSELHFCIDEKKNNPHTISSIKEGLETNNTFDRISASISISEQKSDSGRAAIAILKSAYLLAFYHLGYKYILHSNLDLIRKQILLPEEDIFNGKYILSNERYIPVNLSDGIYLIILNGSNLYGVILSFKAKGENFTHRSLVALPHSEDKDGSVYVEKMRENEESNPIISIKARLSVKRLPYAGSYTKMP